MTTHTARLMADTLLPDPDGIPDWEDPWKPELDAAYGRYMLPDEYEEEDYPR